MKNVLTFALAVILSNFCHKLECTKDPVTAAKTALKTVFKQQRRLFNETNDQIRIITVTRESNGKSGLISGRELSVVMDLLQTLCTGKKTIRDYENFEPTELGTNFSIDNDKVNECANYIVNEMNNPPGLTKPANQIKLIVFNEMFFSQTIPLTWEQMIYIRTQICRISASDSCSIFYPNFLYTQYEERTVEEVNASKNKMMSSSKAKKDKATINDWEKYDEKIKAATKGKAKKSKINNLWLKNETLSINLLAICTKYKKATYFHEANDTIKKGDGEKFDYALYDFGNGEDEIAYDSGMGGALLREISTEICFDLVCGIRKKNYWKNNEQPSKIHILQSNSVDAINEENRLNLPDDKLIIYSDGRQFPIINASGGIILQKSKKNLENVKEVELIVKDNNNNNDTTSYRIRSFLF
jgi:hypothetical protein